jgi:hypothetical protein
MCVACGGAGQPCCQPNNWCAAGRRCGVVNNTCQ